MDGPGIRPAVHEIAARLAEAGYAVALPDLFYRAGPYPPVDPKIVFTDPKLREHHRETLMASTSPAKAMADTRSLLDAMKAMPEVAEGPIGVVGYCMGGRLALIAAGALPRGGMAAAASYHGGGLANDTDDQPTSAGAADQGESLCRRRDRGRELRPTPMKATAGDGHDVEAGRRPSWWRPTPRKHGWVPRDTPAHRPGRGRASLGWDVERHRIFPQAVRHHALCRCRRRS
jgi:carboxymethylenebutenolidase